MKKLVTQFPSLDIRTLAKGYRLSPHTRYKWVWRDKEGELTGGVAVLALRHSVVVIYKGDGKHWLKRGSSSSIRSEDREPRDRGLSALNASYESHSYTNLQMDSSVDIVAASSMRANIHPAVEAMVGGDGM